MKKKDLAPLRTARGYVPGEFAGDSEHPGGRPGKTEPGQAFSIREILDKSTRGIAPSIGAKPHWSPEDMSIDDIDLEKLGQYDLFDKEQALVQAKQVILQARRQAEALKRKDVERSTSDGESDRGTRGTSSVKSKSSKYDDKIKKKEEGTDGPGDSRKREPKRGEDS